MTVEISDTVFEETEKILTEVGKNRNHYINDAIEFYNLLQKRRMISKKLKKESRLVRDESMKVLEEFENLENED